MQFTVTVDGRQRFDDAFDVLREGITDYRELWPEVELHFFRLLREQFESEGARGGTPWSPLSEKYARWKEKRYPGKPILIRTGRLRRSLSAVGAGGTDLILEPEPMSLTVGTRVPYAIHHQRGGKRLPKRPIIQLSRDDFGRFISRGFRFAERMAALGQQAGFVVQTKPGGFEG